MRAGRAAALAVLWRAFRGEGRYGLGERLKALPRLVAGLLRGRYADADGRRLLGVVLGLVYVVSPVDLLPEALLGVLGLADDAFVAAWVAGAVIGELDRFIDWEKARDRVVPGYVHR
ncbi:YkvA family protein [Aquipuribacter sp. SD81]|uniref:YkvA family protein n=1 Tax=Aquipuribacter sp. SD81 TaxID=3127703 RepID=UPI003018EF6C